MHHPIFGHSFAVLVAPILLSVLAFNFLNKKKTRGRKNAEDADTDVSGSLTVPTGTNSGGSSSSPTETNNGAFSSLTTPTGNYYDVFLSFRGSDTRTGFTDHLYNGLIGAGICAFRDEEELRQGEKIRPDLLAAIKNSKILIPVLSVNYGTSSWCLDELVQIMECKNNNTGHIVLPIFYKVEPADLRHQKGSFGKAFRDRERRLRGRPFDPTILEKWKQALVEVSSLKGRDANGSEANLVKLVVQQVLFELKKKFELVIPENLVGIDNHVKKVMEYVDKNSCATLFVGIHGMGGIGKTTLAKTIYNKLSNQFEHRSFVADVRESWKRDGIRYLQNQLLNGILKQGNLADDEDEGINFLSSKLKGKKVLVLIDDVDNDDQLKALAGNHNWFSSGSVIIITTRDESILDRADVNYKHEHEELDEDKCLILFSRHAFRRDTPPSKFEKLTDEVLSTTGGLPLSLEVLGSLFCGKPATQWGGMIEKLKKIPHKKVQEKLRISYETLDNGQKQIFLDVACFAIGIDWRIASYMWDACGFYSKEGIEELRFMSLIKIGENHELKMHDQLRDLGRLIVREGNENKPQDSSRLWDSEEVLKMLKENEGKEKIEAIYLSKDSSIGFGETADQGGDILTGEQFEKLRNLRFLGASGARFSGDFNDSVKKLKWLQWPNCPSTFQAENFHAKELVVLDLSKSKISNEWQGWSSIMMAKKLKYLDLTSCMSLETTSFLSAFENLEVLILAYCTRIEQIDSSIGNMKSLVRLDLTGCFSLKELPAEVGKLEALEQLLLESCYHISSLPDSIGNMKSLVRLDLCSCERLEGLPAEVGKLEALEQLVLELSGIKELPDSIGALQKLKILNIRKCGIKELPDSIGDLQNLEILNISQTDIKELPNGIGRLRNLRDLDAALCSQLGGEMPESIRNLSSLQRLNLDRCQNLQLPSVLPSSLTYLIVTHQNCILPSLSNLTRLKELRLFLGEFLKLIWEHPSTLLEKSLNTPFELEFLIISMCNLMETLDVSQLNHLRKLSVYSCRGLSKIQGLDKLKYLESLIISSCDSIEGLNLPYSKGLKRLWVTDCKNLVDFQGLNKLEFLKELEITSCASIERLDLSKLEGLKEFRAQFCKNLVEIEGLDKLESLEVIDINCASIQRLDLVKSMCIKVLIARHCTSLVEIQGLDGLEFLEVLNLSGCTSFGRLPYLCCIDTLHKLAINCRENLHDIQSIVRFPFCTSLWIEDYKSSEKIPSLSNFRNLRALILSSCHELQEIPGLEESTSLEYIAISGCSAIEILPDLSSCTNLISLVVQNCKKLTELRGLEKLGQRVVLDISGCESLKTIPELFGTQTDRNYVRRSESFRAAMREFEYYNHGWPE